MMHRLLEIFNHPSPPVVVTQEKFDHFDDELSGTSKKRWHEITMDSDGDYIHDLLYVELQQDLFDYLFPAFLVRWWEAQQTHDDPDRYTWDIYGAFSQRHVLTTMMSPERRSALMAWMVDAYIDGVDLWSGRLTVDPYGDKSDRLQGPLEAFHALGYSVPITRPILERLCDVTTEGRAQWWLVISSGIAWNENECPFITPWDPDRGGGGIYVLESAASFSKGYLEENLVAMTEVFNVQSIQNILGLSELMFQKDFEYNWIRAVQTRLAQDPRLHQRRIERFLKCLTEDGRLGRYERPLNDFD